MKPTGGFALAEYWSDADNSPVVEITKALKDGTSIEPNTPTEDFADGIAGPAGKEYTVNIRTAELSAAVHDGLVAAENAQAPLSFRLAGLGTEQIIEDCEDAWNEYYVANVDNDVVELHDRKLGTHAAEITVNIGFSTGRLSTEAISPTLNLTAHKSVLMFIKSTIAMAAGDLQLLLDDSAECATPLETLNIPALSAGVWTRVALLLANPAALTAIISVGIKLTVDKGAFILLVDDVRAAAPSWIVKRAIPTHVDQPGAAGRFHSKKITAKAFGVTQADVITVVP